MGGYFFLWAPVHKPCVTRARHVPVTTVTRDGAVTARVMHGAALIRPAHGNASAVPWHCLQVYLWLSVRGAALRVTAVTLHHCYRVTLVTLRCCYTLYPRYKPLQRCSRTKPSSILGPTKGLWWRWLAQRGQQPSRRELVGIERG